jgi:hypothetical protein
MGSTQSAEVHASLDVRTGPSKAEQFARALGIVSENVQPIIKQSVADKARAETIAGIEAAMKGEADPSQQGNEYYERGFFVTAARREVVDAKAAWNELAQKEGLNELPPAEFAKRQEVFLRETLGHLAAHPEASAAVLDDLLGFQAKSIADHRAYQQEQRDKAYEDDSGALLGAAYDTDPASLAAAAQAAHDEHHKMLGGTRSNETIVSQLGALAVAKGDPAILDAIPERARSVPRLGRVIEQYRREAESARDLKDAAQERDTEERRKLARAEARNSIAVNILDGRFSQRQVRDLVAAGVLDFEDARALMNFAEDTASDRGGGDEEGSLAALQMEAQVRKGEAGIDDIMSSNLSVKDKRRLLASAATADNAVNRSLKSDLGRRFTPPRALGGEVNPADIVLQADVLREFDERVQNGEDPRKVYEDIKKAHPEKFKQAAPAGKTVTTNVPGVSVQEIG